MASLSELMAAAEQADSDYRVAVVGAANARADYEMLYHDALARAEQLPSAAARKEYADIAANAGHRIWLMKEAQEKAARTHVQVLLGLLVAKQSLLKMDRGLDGGDW